MHEPRNIAINTAYNRIYQPHGLSLRHTFVAALESKRDYCQFVLSYIYCFYLNEGPLLHKLSELVMIIGIVKVGCVF
jgi:hypothetical protein